MGRRSTGKTIPKWRIVALGLGFAALGTSLTVIYSTHTIYMSAYKVWTWAPVEATVLSKAVKSGRDATSCYPVIRYKYTVDGRQYTSDSYNFTRMESSEYKSQERIISRYEIGGKYTAYYDPHDPSQAVLERVPSTGAFLLVFFGPAILVAGVAMMLSPGRCEAASTPVAQRDLSGRSIRPERQTLLVLCFIIVSAFFLAIPAVVIADEIRESGGPPWRWESKALVLSMVLAAVGITITYRIARSIFAARFFRGVSMDVAPAPIGGNDTVVFKINDTERRASGASVNAHLVYKAKGKTFEGSEGETKEKAFYEEHLDLLTSADASALEGSFVLPDTPLPVFESASGFARWYIRLTKGKYTAWLPLPVKPAGPDGPRQDAQGVDSSQQSS